MSNQSIIPMSSPDITAAEQDAVREVLTTRWLSIGPQVEAFEAEVAACAGARYGVAVNSGTSGLHLAVIAAGVGDGDRVITTPFSFIASANCILYERGVPIFVDVDPATGNIDPALVAEAAHDLQKSPESGRRWLPPALRNGRGSDSLGRLAALLPVHAFGQPAAMDDLAQVALQHRLPIIEDACEALGGEYRHRRIGSLSNAAVFAFYPNKQITTGEGGMIVTDDEEWANVFRSLRNQGRDVFDEWLNHSRLGYNYRLDEMSAALGLVQIQRIDELLAKRVQVAAWYNQRLANSECYQTPAIVADTTRMSWFVYVVRVRPPLDRTAVMHALAEAGIPSRPYFTPIHLQSFYRQRYGYQRGDFPVTENLGDISLALPFSSVQTEDQVDQVCQKLLSLTPH